MTDSKRESLLMTERRLFEHQILNTLVEADALTQPQAASVCTQMTNHLSEIMETDRSPMAQSLLPKLIEKWEYVASALLGQNPPPKGN